MGSSDTSFLKSPFLNILTVVFLIFRTDCCGNVNGIAIGDECYLILDDNNEAGVEEFTDAFFASPGVESSLISKEWVSNHYKWIVWKFAHYETSFPKQFGGQCLTPDNLMLQLKYRYDREVDHNERSALKKILERDDSSAKRLVLCVCKIKKVILKFNIATPCKKKFLYFYYF